MWGIFWIPMSMSVMCTCVLASVGLGLGDLWEPKMVSIHFKVTFHRDPLRSMRCVIRKT